MSKVDTEVVRDIATKFIKFRKDFQSRSGAPRHGEVKEFLERSRNLSFEFANALDIRDPEIMVAFSELANLWVAETKTPGFVA